MLCDEYEDFNKIKLDTLLHEGKAPSNYKLFSYEVVEKMKLSIYIYDTAKPRKQNAIQASSVGSQHIQEIDVNIMETEVDDETIQRMLNWYFMKHHRSVLGCHTLVQECSQIIPLNKPTQLIFPVIMLSHPHSVCVNGQMGTHW